MTQEESRIPITLQYVSDEEEFEIVPLLHPVQRRRNLSACETIAADLKDLGIDPDADPKALGEDTDPVRVRDLRERNRLLREVEVSDAILRLPHSESKLKSVTFYARIPELSMQDRIEASGGVPTADSEYDAEGVNGQPPPPAPRYIDRYQGAFEEMDPRPNKDGTGPVRVEFGISLQEICFHMVYPALSKRRRDFLGKSSSPGSV